MIRRPPRSTLFPSRRSSDLDPVDLALPRPGEAVEGGANGYGHGAGAADARASGSFRIGSEGEAALRMEEFGDFREERERSEERRVGKECRCRWVRYD